MLTDEQIAEGWIAHDGGSCPVPRETWPALLFRNGVREQGIDRSDWCEWSHDGSWSDIIAYRKELPDAR